jgi:hypothetical protein
MSDLDKLMQKLKKDKEKSVEELPIEEVEQAIIDLEEEEEDPDEEDEEEEAKPIAPVKPLKKVVKAIPKEDPVEIEEEIPEFDQSIEAEVGLFQNNGIFRREIKH